MKNILSYLPILLLDLAGVLLIALHQHLWGWIILCLGAATLIRNKREFRNDIILVYICIAILGITPINTDISPTHIFIMSIPLSLAIILPYCISRYVYKNNHITFKFHHGRNWYKTEIAYIFFAALITYIFFPPMLRFADSYKNWTVNGGFENISMLFLGTNALGLWDELFFISTVLGVFRRYISFPLANLAQSILFTAFLHELGFRGLATGVVFLFALTQGYIFKKTESLFYLITVHLTIDFILFLALIYLHHPDWLPIFFT